VAKIWGIPEEALKTKTRKRTIVEPRQVVMWFRKKNTKESLAEIGERYGKDHATVLHAVKTVNNLKETDKEFRRKVELAQKRIEHERKMQMRKELIWKRPNSTITPKLCPNCQLQGTHNESGLSQINDLPKNE
jgi:hypothetical protein